MLVLRKREKYLSDSRCGSQTISYWGLFYNEEEIEGVDVNYESKIIFSSNYESIRTLMKFIPDDFPPRTQLKFGILEEFDCFRIGVEITGFYIGAHAYNIHYSLVPLLSEWNNPYTFNQYQGIFTHISSDISDGFYSSWGYVENSFNFSISVNFEKELIENKIFFFAEKLKQCHKETIRALEENFSLKALNTYFDFPEKIKVSCKQYLEYFATFLRDLVGIDATSNLKEEAGKVLFSVTPADDIEALDKIREALAVYLNLPSSPVLYNDSFQSMQLKQQVENLQHSQRMKEIEMRSAQYALRLAQQNIENQDKIIASQNSFIDNQNKIIEKITSKSIMIDSLENKEELEKFCEGFEVGKSEFLIKHFGLHLNPATVLKNAGKKILGKEEHKSVLGLDEGTNQENS